MRIIKRRKGFALIFAIVIAVAMMVPVLMLLTSLAPRRMNTTGEGVSDRVLSMSDASIDNIINQINTFPFNFVTPPIVDESGSAVDAADKAQDYLIAYYLSQLNGGVPDIAHPVESYNTISNNVSSYFYNLDTQEMFAIWDNLNSKIANVSSIGPNGDIFSKSGYIKNLSTGDVTTLDSFRNTYPNYKSDNLWVEMDSNTKYWPGEPDKWQITVTSYFLSKPDIKRTVQASASKGEIVVNTSEAEVANGSWFTHDSTTTTKKHYFADYSGLYHTKVYFGRFETTTGPIRSDGNLYMGGWAKDPVFANGRVYDYAVDGPSGNHLGRFGPNAKNLSWAKNNGYAKDNYPDADWANVLKALFGSNAVRNPTDPNGGIQDKALPEYYINGNATIVFNDNGTVTINGSTLPMPPNGIIFVENTATVSGTVKGQCSVGARKINIGGNIIYSTPPRLDRNEPIPPNPDLLGLISHGDITITKETFLNNPHLRIDAAMISGTGNFGIASDTPSHTIDPTGTYEAWWNGAQASWNTSNAPAVFLGYNRVRGYEIQHTNYDWNLRDYGVPPYFPVTNEEETVDIIDTYPVVGNESILDYLRKLTKSDLIPLSPSDPAYNQGLRYKYVYQGVTYYYGSTFNFVASATAQLNKTSLYRIYWKEQISEPVKP